jgi:hypothetical protein
MVKVYVHSNIFITCEDKSNNRRGRGGNRREMKELQIGLEAILFYLASQCVEEHGDSLVLM